MWSIAASSSAWGMLWSCGMRQSGRRNSTGKPLVLSRESGDPKQYATGLTNLGYEHY